MPNRYRTGYSTFISFFILLISLGGFASHISFADSFTERRIQVGMKLFRTLVKADLDIARKINSNGELPITLLYIDNKSQAIDYQHQLQQSFSSINDMPVVVQIESLTKLLKTKQQSAAIFITQTLTDEERQVLVNYSLTQHVIMFSPFAGDVENGVLAGLSVQATVQPLLNMHSLTEGQFTIKPFYIKVAKHYE